MSIEAIALMNPATVGIDTVPAHTFNVAPPDTKGSVFESLLDGAASLNRQMQANEQSLQALALGETDNLHRVMMNLESTKLSFDLMLQVRSKLLDAYQELMRQQV